MIHRDPAPQQVEQQITTQLTTELCVVVLDFPIVRCNENRKKKRFFAAELLHDIGRVELRVIDSEILQHARVIAVAADDEREVRIAHPP